MNCVPAFNLDFAMPFVVTASALSTGRPLYRTAQGRWSPSFGLAHAHARQELADQALAQARADEAEACDPYLIEAEAKAQGLRLQNLREQIRATGPTVDIL